jgi:DNA-binding PadR family transcriptional regulator
MKKGGEHMYSHSHAFDPRVAGLLRFAQAGGHGRHSHGRGRRGRGGWGGPGHGGFGGHRGPRARRGDVRAALLALLAEEPRNGYGLMQEIEQRSDGVWRPSPGSVYPALQQLEDEGLVRQVEQDGRKAYELTDEGRAHVEERGDELAAPWDAVKDDVGEGRRELGALIRQLAMAMSQVVAAGSDAQVAEAARVLKDARRALYEILAAEDEPTQEA